MRLSRIGYYGDFVVYPPLVAGLALTALWRSQTNEWPTLLVTFVAGLGFWTFAEYILHRYVLHHVPFIKDMHDEHHDNQKELIGTPTWLSMAMICAAVLVPLWLLADLSIASGATAGLMLGYLWYVSAHHIVHHWDATPGTYGFALKRRHALHHYFDDQGNFGVTSGFWDRVFRTEITVRRRRETEGV